jgi:hypothetical protein
LRSWSCGNHLVIAVDDGFAAVAGDGVGHQQIVVRQLAILAPQAETFLIIFDRGDDHFFGHVQIVFVK